MKTADGQPKPTTGSANARDAIARCGVDFLRQAWRLARLRSAWVALGLLLAAQAADALFGLHGALRALLAAGVVAASLWAGLRLRRRLLDSPSLERMVARRIESRHPGLANALINALDFRERLERDAAGPASTDMMRAEIDRADRSAGEVCDPRAIRPEALRNEPRLLAGLALGVAVFAVLLPRVFFATLPRLLAPWGDFPPYSPTRLSVEPAGARVEYGAGLDLTIRAGGRRPASVALVLEGRRSGRRVELPVYESAPDIYARTIENVTEDMVYYARIPGGRSHRHRLGVIVIPRIQSVAYTCVPPPYTRLPAEDRALAGGAIRGYAGSRVTLRIASNRDLRDGELRIGRQTIPLRSDGSPKTVSATFDLDTTTAGAFDGFVRDVEGNASADRAWGRVDVIPDEPPEVAFVAPGKDSFATPDASVPLNIEARDDVAVGDVQLYRRLNGSADFRKTLYGGPAQHPFVNAIEELDLKSLGVRPGDTIEYYATATDNRPAAPGHAASPAFRLLIISQEDYANMVRTQMTAEALRAKYDALLEALRGLANQQEQIREQSRQAAAELGEGTLPEGSRVELQRLAEAQARLAERTRGLAQRYAEESSRPEIYDVEEDYHKALAEMAKRLAAAAGQMDAGRQAMTNAAGAASAPAARSGMAGAGDLQDTALALLGRVDEDFRKGVSQAGQTVEDLFALYQDVETYKQLLALQEAVARQSRFLAERRTPDLDDKVRLKQLGEEQSAIRGQLETLAGDLRRHAQRVEKLHPKVAADACGIADRIASLGIPPLMNRASEELVRLAAAEGHASAQAAYEAMRSLVSFCNSTGGNAETECEERLRIVMQMKLGNTFSQLGQGLPGSLASGLGGVGRGDRGVGGSVQSPFGLYGGSDLLNSVTAPSSMLGRNRVRSQAAPEGSLDAAGDGEELRVSDKSALQIAMPRGEPVIEDYRRLILQYFTRMLEGGE